MLQCLLLISRCCTPFARHANGTCATVQRVLFSYPEILYHSFGPTITSVLHESRWQTNNAKVASLVFCLLASVEDTTVCLEISLQSPPPPSRPPQGQSVARYGGRFQGGEVPAGRVRPGRGGMRHAITRESNHNRPSCSIGHLGPFHGKISKYSRIGAFTCIEANLDAAQTPWRTVHYL